MAQPTVFLSAASDDLKHWRDILDGAFREAGCTVYTQERSLGAARGDVRTLLTDNIDRSRFVIHLAGLAYGSDAAPAFPESPGFQCSWTQFEYYYAHQRGKEVIAFVCAQDFPYREFTERGKDADDVARKTRLQQEHRARVASGEFDGTPLAGLTGRTLNKSLASVQDLLREVAACVGTMKDQSHGDLGAVSARLSALAALHTIPAPKPGFVGRQADLAKLRAIDPARGAVLTGLRGMGGIGKTELALVLAREWRGRFPDAQLKLDGRGTQPHPPSAADLLAQVIHAFQPQARLPEEESTLRGIYHGLLKDRRILILLDNAADAAQAAPLIPPPGSGLLVTSRRGFMLGGLAPHSVDRLPEEEAIALLREHRAPLTDAEAQTLARLCGYLPLALRLAGSHLALDASERGGRADVAGYLARLRSGRLATLDADAPDAGEITISETLRLSEALLPEPERAAWRALGIFAGSFDARAAEAVAGASETMLAGFVRRSMLERAEGDRYLLHDLAADYARATLGEEALANLTLAHARHYATVAKEAQELYLAGKPVEGLALFDRERGQIEAAFERLSRTGVPPVSSRGLPAGEEPSPAEAPGSRDARPTGQAGSAGSLSYAELLLDLVNAVAYTGHLRFHSRQRIAWLEAQLAAARLMGNRQHEGIALGNLGLAHANLGDARRAIGLYEQQLAIAREIGDRRGESTAFGNLGNAHFALGDARRAIEFHEQQLAIARGMGDRRGESNALGDLGVVHADLGDARRAIEFHEQALVLYRMTGDRLGEGNALGNLGVAHKILGDMRRAIECYEQHLAIAREIGDQRGESIALGNLGSAHYGLRDARRAIEFYEKSLIVDREIGDRRGEATDLWNSALAHASLGNRAEAIAQAQKALRIREAIEDPNVGKVRAALASWSGVKLGLLQRLILRLRAKLAKWRGE